MRQSQIYQLCTFLALACGLVSLTRAQAPAPASQRPFYVGADISMLPEIEKAGGVFRDASGAPADAIKIFRDHGFNLFRVRLFVNPTKDFNSSWGATQDLDYV